jgi:hypothetical protein
MLSAPVPASGRTAAPGLSRASRGTPHPGCRGFARRRILAQGELRSPLWRAGSPGLSWRFEAGTDAPSSEGASRSGAHCGGFLAPVAHENQRFSEPQKRSAFLVARAIEEIGLRAPSNGVAGAKETRRFPCARMLRILRAPEASLPCESADFLILLQGSALLRKK